MNNAKQTKLGLAETTPVHGLGEYKFEPIKGYPMLNWRGKRPFTSTHYYPAQLREVYGEEIDGWRNKIFWGDNIQVMSHLLDNFRGKINLIYIDPPFDSRVDYKKRVTVKKITVENDLNSFEEKQYTDIWTNDEYLQYIYERVVILRELLSEDGCLYLHCDPRKSHLLRGVLDEVFGSGNFVNEIVWKYTKFAGKSSGFHSNHDTILLYSKSTNYKFNKIRIPVDKPRMQTARVWDPVLKKAVQKKDDDGNLIYYVQEDKGVDDTWTDIQLVNPMAKERLDYPTQKPEDLLERIIESSSDVGDIVLDCFMGSGTTQAVAMKLGRRFIGADINLGAIQITTKRLLGVADEYLSQSDQAELFLSEKENEPSIRYLGFEVYNVNHYEVFRNPIEARDLLLEALEVNKLPQGQLFDGEKDGRMIKIMPVNRIATRADLGELIAGLDLKAFEKRHKKNPNEPVERITLVCMGHEPDLKASLMKEVEPYKLDVEVVDILRDRSDLQFKRDSEAKIVIKSGKLVIERFYPMNLLGKLSLQKEKVKDWKELVESVMIDWNYDGAVLSPSTVDIPEKDEMVSGTYPIPKDAGTIRVKITDLLSESLEVEVENG